ncbi:MAG: YihY/virulence factor BrkB family protein [Planctomycetota bacterium]
MRLLRHQMRMWSLCARRLRENNAVTLAAALAFRTIFALVPTLVLAYVVLKPFGALNMQSQVRGLLGRAGLDEVRLVRDEHPERREAPPGATTRPGQDRPARRRPQTLVGHIERMVGRIEQQLTLGVIGPVGVLWLVYSAVALLTGVERSLNRVFDVPRSRRFLHRAMLYWAAVTLVPITFLAARWATGRAADAAAGVPAVGWLLAALARAPTTAVGVFLLAGVYCAIPNTRVRFRFAVSGALVTVVCWFVAQWGFRLFVIHGATRSIYGALALIPLFLIWVYLWWIIFLFGAVLTYAAGNVHALRAGAARPAPQAEPWDLLAVAAVIARSHEDGTGPVSRTELARALSTPAAEIDRLTGALKQMGVISPAGAEAEGFLPTRPPRDVAVADLLGATADEPPRRTARTDRMIAAARRHAAGRLAGLTLADVLAADEGGG